MKTVLHIKVGSDEYPDPTPEDLVSVLDEYTALSETPWPTEEFHLSSGEALLWKIPDTYSDEERAHLKSMVDYALRDTRGATIVTKRDIQFYKKGEKQ